MENVQQRSQRNPHVETSMKDVKLNHIKIGKISFVDDEENVIGTGHAGTVVYRGKFESRDVAVKRLIRGHCETEMWNEVSLLVDSDSHESVVKYFAMVG